MSSLFGADLRFILAVCAILAFVSLLLIALRARRLGVSAGGTAVAVALVALCMSSRLGIAFDAAAWFFAALLVFVLDRGERYQWYLPLIVLAWSVTVDSGTIGAAIVLIWSLGAFLDSRSRDVRMLKTLGIAIACCLASLVSASGVSLIFGGARALYFDMLLLGADRQPLWSSPVTLSAVAVFAIVVIAAIGGIARRKQTANALLFVSLLVAAVLDARMAPFFAIALTPVIFARYEGLLRIPSVLGVAAAAAAIIIAAAVHPASMNATLIAHLARDGRPHRVVCVKPSWCNPVALLRGNGITALTMGIPSASSPRDRQLQKRIDDDTSAIFNDLRLAHADAVIASELTAAPALLTAEGSWHVAARDGDGRMLIVKGNER